MLDMKFIKENAELVKENIRKKFKEEKLPLVDEAIALYDEKLAAHIAAEVSTNTTSGVYEFSIDTCYRTCESFGFSVMRTPPVKPGMCIIVF